MKSTFARKKSGYIPTLDGWRAVAILGVMLFHGGPLFSQGSRLEDLRLMGEDGVRLFFAISGNPAARNASARRSLVCITVSRVKKNDLS